MSAELSDSIHASPILDGEEPVRGRSSLEAEVAGLFEQLRMPLLRCLGTIRIPAADSEEAIQQAFLELYRHMRAGKSCSNPGGWVFRAAYRLALKTRARARRQSEIFNTDPEMAELVADASPGPERDLAAQERRRRLLAIVRALPEQDQWCLSLRAEGLRYRQIAEIVGISLGSVAGSIEKSLQRLMRAERTGGEIS